MIRSMTAYANVEEDSDIGLIKVELRSVNSRFLDLSLRMPESLRMFEASVREIIGQHVTRGKMDVNIRHHPELSGVAQLHTNNELLDQLSASYLRIHSQFPDMRVEFTDLLQFPGVLQTETLDAETSKAALTHALRSALQIFITSREREGMRLGKGIEEKLTGIEDCVNAMKARLPQIIEGVTQRMRDRLSDLPAPVDEGRFEQELVLALTKMDVAEELDRLIAHVQELKHQLDEGGVVGRRLDFLLQEFNREANTLASKSVDTQGTQIAVDLKVLIEQIREQVQNIE